MLAVSEHVLGIASSEAAGLGLEVQEDGICIREHISAISSESLLFLLIFQESLP